MVKNIIVFVTLTSFCLYQVGCFSTQGISRKDFMEDRYQWIEKVVTNDGGLYEFTTSHAFGNGETASWGGSLVGDSVKGTLRDGAPKSFPISDIRMFYITKFSATRTILCVIGVTGLVAGLVAIAGSSNGGGYTPAPKGTSSSCPFVYSFDGQQFRFDGEPYGGSICEALERTDYCRLDYLRPVNGEYKLMLTNEVDETQYTDEFKLCVIDHPTGTQVLPDAAGHFYTVRQPFPPTAATDKIGTDITRWISKTDDIFWESGIHPGDTAGAGTLRDTLTVTFPKPAAHRSGKLAVSASNTLWGSHMLKRYLDLWGGHADAWYQLLTNADTLAVFGAWQRREEVFRLQVMVWADGRWTNRGEIFGGGPFMTEERVVPLNLEGVDGDSVKIRLCPPTGFWQINSLAIDYSADEQYGRQDLAAASIIGDDGDDLRAVLESTDHRYYDMPNSGQTASVVFPVPPAASGRERTLFARLSGYYDIHLQHHGPLRLDLCRKIAAEPGYFTKFALQEYYRWRAEQLTSAEASY
jgi:hypothetical protein